MLSAMILCAGFGTRLRPLTDSIPKPLLPVGDRPALVHIIDRVRGQGWGPIVMNTHHRADAFQGVVPEDVHVVHEAGGILGTAGGVANAGRLLGDGDTLVWNGDILAEPDLEELERYHSTRRSDVIATLLAAPRPRGQGTIGVGAGGNVVRLRGREFGDELSGGDFLGIQILTQRGRQRLPASGCLVGDVYLPALEHGERVAVRWYEGPWDDIGNPRALLDANKRWLHQRGLSAWVHDKATIGQRVRLAGSVVCEGATVGGDGELTDCLVLPNAHARAPMRRTIFWNGGDALAA